MGLFLYNSCEANPDTTPPRPSARSTVSLPFRHERQAQLFTVSTSIQVSPSCEQATRATASPLRAATAWPVRLHFEHQLFSLPHSPCLKDRISGEFRSKTSVIFSFSQLHMSVSYSLPSPPSHKTTDLIGFVLQKNHSESYCALVSSRFWLLAIMLDIFSNLTLILMNL